MRWRKLEEKVRRLHTPPSISKMYEVKGYQLILSFFCGMGEGESGNETSQQNSVTSTIAIARKDEMRKEGVYSFQFLEYNKPRNFS